MKKNKTHNPHRFIANIFGSVGYAALIFVWLLLVVTGIVCFYSADSSVFFAEFGSAISADQSTTSPGHEAFRFVLIIALAIVAWGLVHYGSLLMSFVMRKFIKITGGKLSLEMLATVKYLSLTIGLLATALLLVFMPTEVPVVKFAIALLGFVAGLAGFATFWIQHLIASRHKLRFDDVR